MARRAGSSTETRRCECEPCVHTVCLTSPLLGVTLAFELGYNIMTGSSPSWSDPGSQSLIKQRPTVVVVTLNVSDPMRACFRASSRPSRRLCSYLTACMDKTRHQVLDYWVLRALGRFYTNIYVCVPMHSHTCVCTAYMSMCLPTAQIHTPTREYSHTLREVGP